MSCRKQGTFCLSIHPSFCMYICFSNQSSLYYLRAQRISPTFYKSSSSRSFTCLPVGVFVFFVCIYLSLFLCYFLLFFVCLCSVCLCLSVPISVCVSVFARLSLPFCLWMFWQQQQQQQCFNSKFWNATPIDMSMPQWSRSLALALALLLSLLFSCSHSRFALSHSHSHTDARAHTHRQDNNNNK